MLIPNSRENIYPNNHENIRAILQFYFHLHDGSLNLNMFSSLEINQIEYIAMQVSNHLDFFKEKVPKGMTINNLMGYGISALATPYEYPKNNRMKITNEFRDLVINNSGKTFE